MQSVVYLVGAGPGDVGLLTVAGAEALKNADAVVYDYLANAELLSLCRPDAERIYVGKSASQHTKTQDEINAILVAQAQLKDTQDRPRTIVRLKGGDPYVFGRGGEEAAVLRSQGIPFVVIPGITAGIAAPAYAGIPVTHREFASTMTLVTGHEKEKADGAPEDDSSQVDYASLAGLAKAGGTLVFYMGVKSLPTITAKLAANGLDPATPAAVIRWGTRAEQCTVQGTLATIADVVKAAGITAPAITIIGKVVTLRDQLNWFEERPLFGQKVLVTRTRQQASNLTKELLALGAQVIEAPTIEVEELGEDEELDTQLARLPAADWIVFTSANGVEATWKRLRRLTFDARHFAASNIAAIGPATGDALAKIGIFPDLVPERSMGEELADALVTHVGKDEVRGKRFVLLRADIARPALRDKLSAMGAIVEDLAVYETRQPEALPDDILRAIDGDIGWVTFTSASTATNLWNLLPPPLREKVAQMKRVSIGPLTTAALTEVSAGKWTPTITAARHDISGMVAAIRDSIAK